MKMLNMSKNIYKMDKLFTNLMKEKEELQI